METECAHPEGYPLVPMFRGLLIKRPFQDGMMSALHTNCSFQGTSSKSSVGNSLLQLNIEGLTASKMNVLHHLAIQLEAFVILLQETHCISAEKLVLSNYQLAGFYLSRKHGLATFVHERLKWTLYNQSPTTSETEWLCVDYKIVNIYKP